MRGSLRHGVGRVPGSSSGGVAAPRFSETSKFVRIRPCPNPAVLDGRWVRMATGLHARRTACAMHGSRAAGLHARRCTFLPPVQPARLARGQACAEPVSRRPGCVFLCMISVSWRPSVRVRRPDLPSPGCVAEESWRGAQDTRGARRAGRRTLASDARGRGATCVRRREDAAFGFFSGFLCVYSRPDEC